jgi:hypothetical protein
MKKNLLLVLLLTVLQAAQSQTIWPALTQQTKPWTRWWWMGSAVDEKSISTALQQYAAAGFGGTEIVPIYGAKGYESRYIKYLSPQWMKMLDHTVQQSNKLDMGVYISVGTGWPIGGTHVTSPDAASKLLYQQYNLKANEYLAEKIVIKDNRQKDVAVLSALMAYDKNGKAKDLSKNVMPDGTLNYVAPEDLAVYAIFTAKTKQAVKRAAPGGEGFTIDHFSAAATANYLKIFDSAFGNSSHGVKAFFNDSYEVYNADWTPAFFDEFRKRRGYDLRDYFNQFTSASLTDTVARLKSDYRQTMSDLMRENFSSVFTQWTNKRKTLSVNQAHGSPGNLLDLYGAFDIPETETFGSSAFAVRGLRRDSADIRKVDPDPYMLKFASSAAHAYRKPLTSCETFTWLGEHFKTSWSQCKPEVDQVFLAGINHVFYHGTTFSPMDAPYPGWLFYASVNFVPNNSLWPHLSGLNNYISRVQSVLQAGEPDNEVKAYWPVYDAWSNPKGLDMPLGVHSIDEWLHPTSFYKNVKALDQKGFSLDFVSDKMLKDQLEHNLMMKRAKYAVYLVPKCKLMPVATLETLIGLAQDGDIVVMESLPEDVPGLGKLDEQRAAFNQLKSSLAFTNVAAGIGEYRQASWRGKIILSADVQKGLEYARLKRETMTDYGLKFIRREIAGGKYYFVVNLTANDIDTTVSLPAFYSHAFIMNPLNGESGKLSVTSTVGSTSFRLQLKSGQSALLKLGRQTENIAAWKHTQASGTAISLKDNNWTLHFKSGGPSLPADKKMKGLRPWTSFITDSTTQSFSGTGVYSTSFTIKIKATDYLLQLDKLHESARIIVNGKEAGLIWSLPYEIKIGKYLKPGINTISIEVNNLMANRIRNMDKNGITWRNYHEINFVNINYKNFDASTWPVQVSGLEGDARLVPLR